MDALLGIFILALLIIVLILLHFTFKHIVCLYEQADIVCRFTLVFKKPEVLFV